ncbi:MAG: heme o synthase [Candidatus Doudnabacteria bacterium]
MFKIYYQLTKPGIIYGNAITTIAGFFLASRGHMNWRLLLATLVGLSLVIASACVFNNLYDRDIDRKMERTRSRALVTGSISKTNAIIFGIVLIFLGAFVLRFHTNTRALLAALFGFFVYVFAYTPLKHRSVHATLVGAIAGAVPPVVGYTAVTNRFDLAALLLFLILVAWQMPHFYAIAIRRLDEYRSAGIPVLPVQKGIAVTKINILLYIVAFIIATTLLTLFGFAGYIYLVVMLLFGLIWLTVCIQGFRANNNDSVWARNMFKFSLVVLLVFSVAISINAII